jgi:hypothetical protein
LAISVNGKSTLARGILAVVHVLVARKYMAAKMNLPNIATLPSMERLL